MGNTKDAQTEMSTTLLPDHLEPRATNRGETCGKKKLIGGFMASPLDETGR